MSSQPGGAFGDDLRNRAVLVTGASRGIGAAIALGFARCGARVALHYHRSELVYEVAASASRAGAPDTTVIQGDFRRPQAAGEVVRQALERFGDLDVLVNNAGDLIERRPLAAIDAPFLHDALQLNFCSTVLACQAAMPSLERRGGAVINVTSVAAETGGGGNSSIYAASKAAVNTFTRAMAVDYARVGVRVNAISPGAVLTAFHDRHTEPSRLEERARAVPMGRLGEPDDLVGAALFLASPAASGYVTGQILEINGGWHMR